MNEAKQSLDQILNGFQTSQPDSIPTPLTAPITLWVSEEHKTKYDRLQEKSRRRFSKKARELLCTAIDIADAQAV